MRFASQENREGGPLTEPRGKSGSKAAGGRLLREEEEGGRRRGDGPGLDGTEVHGRRSAGLRAGEPRLPLPRSPSGGRDPARRAASCQVAAGHDWHKARLALPKVIGAPFPRRATPGVLVSK